MAPKQMSALDKFHALRSEPQFADMNMIDFDIMLSLIDQGPDHPTVGELGARLEPPLLPSRMTKYATKLEKLGLVRRFSREGDLLSVFLSPTSEGRAFGRRIVRIMDGFL
jgi:DNA-binding MarR family transcriptional regulator